MIAFVDGVNARTVSWIIQCFSLSSDCTTIRSRYVRGNWESSCVSINTKHK